MNTAVVVARAGSVRLPNKALLPFDGSISLIAHKIRQLARCRKIDSIVVGSDSDEILADAKMHGALTAKREAYFCDEAKCSANEMIGDMASRVEGDVIIWAHPTSPLVRPETYDAAIESFDRGYDNLTCDSLASVAEVRRHAWKNGRPINYNPWRPRHTLAKDCEPIYFQDGAIFIQRRFDMVANSYFFGWRPHLFVMPAGESADIDTAADFAAAKLAWEARQ
jgi:CMP-N,N'-diacetyllegionaminic acid synthase